MNTSTAIRALATVLLLAVPASASARALSVDVWTDRGNDGVYRPGDVIEVKARTSQDAHLLVYEIDAEGYVHVLFPFERSSGFVEGRSTYRLAEDRPDAELVVQGPTGQGYIVAIASVEPFETLPWYLRPIDPKAEELGYAGRPESEEEGVTAEGRIVGDPFVAMERIRRAVVENPEDGDSFATDYVGYYVHTQVRYPRYLCYDCHRPRQWAWWDGFDPYYTRCSVFDFRINYGWYWGPSYWFGHVPYYVYVYRDDCPPHFRRRYPGHWPWYSSWDGWGRWQTLWGGNLRRFKTPPPPGYDPPSKYDREFRRRDGGSLPPGFLARSGAAIGPRKSGIGRRSDVPFGRQLERRGDSSDDVPSVKRTPRGEPARPSERGDQPTDRVRRGPASPPPSDRSPADQPGERRERRETPAPVNREQRDRGASSPAPSVRPRDEERREQRIEVRKSDPAPSERPKPTVAPPPRRKERDADH